MIIIVVKDHYSKAQPYSTYSPKTKPVDVLETLEDSGLSEPKEEPALSELDMEIRSP
ncbi:MAG: hypothetical protein ACRD8Z_18780 [Nitrososphaeraceae archaeon]